MVRVGTEHMKRVENMERAEDTTTPHEQHYPTNRRQQ